MYIFKMAYNYHIASYPNEADGVVGATPQRVVMGLLNFIKCI